MQDKAEFSEKRAKNRTEQIRENSLGKVDLDWASGRIRELSDEGNSEGYLVAFVNALAEVGYDETSIKSVLAGVGRVDIEYDIQKSVEEKAKSYLQQLGLSWEMLKNKKILDVGAAAGAFAKVAGEHGVEVVSVDDYPTYGVPKNMPYFIADAEHLPFGDNTFDLVVARAIIPLFADEPIKEANVFEDVKRVLKKGGEFRFGPVMTISENKSLDKEYDKIYPNFKKVDRGNEWSFYTFVKQ